MIPICATRSQIGPDLSLRSRLAVSFLCEISGLSGDCERLGAMEFVVRDLAVEMGKYGAGALVPTRRRRWKTAV